MAHPPNMAIPSDHILRWHLVEHTPSILNAPHFAYLSTKLLPTKTSDSNPLWMICWWTHLPSSSVTMLAHAFNNPTKVTESGHTPSCCICRNSSSAFCPCPYFACSNTLAFQVTTFWDTLQASSMFPHFAYMPTKLLHWKTSWTSLPSSSAPKPAHALITWTKVNLSGLIASCCIWWKSCIAFSGCPSFTYFVRFWFHPKMLNCTMPRAIAAIHAANHGRFHQSPSQSNSCVFLWLKFGYLSFV